MTQSAEPDLSTLVLPRDQVIQTTSDKPKPPKLAGLEVVTADEGVQFINMLIYGNPGAGKTRLAASAIEVPEMSPVLVLDVEGGTLSLRDVYPQVHVVRITSWNDMQNLANELARMKHGYKTVVVDSLSEIQRFSMSMIMREVIAQDGDRDPDVPSIREWGKNGEQTRRLVRFLRDLPLNAIFTAHLATDKDPRTGLFLNEPSLSGKLKKEIPGFLDEVVYLYSKLLPQGKDLPPADKRLLLTGLTDQYVCKDRSGKLDQVVEEPTMAKLYAQMFGR